MSINNQEMEVMGYKPVYNYTQYSHDHHVNVIPKESFNKLVQDTFETIVDQMASTYGPYGSTIMISEQSQTITTKDGYNVFSAIGFSHEYKRLVYLAIKKICDRVNRTVGDGTTSCILLADRLFRHLKDIIKTPDDSRNIMDALNYIERAMQDPNKLSELIKNGKIRKLNKNSIKTLIRLASNSDEDLTQTMYAAMVPDAENFDEDGNVKSIRNVVVESEVVYKSDMTQYAIDYLPGDYRIRIAMDPEAALQFHEKSSIKIALYSCSFDRADWTKFQKNYDTASRVLIIAKSFQRTFLETDYMTYIRNCATNKIQPRIVLCEIKGDYVQDEVKDLAAMLDTPYFDVHSKEVNFDELKVVELNIHKGNAMCFYNLTKPEKYISLLKDEIDADLKKSFAKREAYYDRINALSMLTRDTLVTLKASSSLELKMLTDKIDDCTSIVKSALLNGIVPNMLSFAHWNVNDIKKDLTKDDNLTNIIKSSLDCIAQSIVDLMHIVYDSSIYESTPETEETFKEIHTDFYNNDDLKYSYNIIIKDKVDMELLPTSSQYDIEVVNAAISIVKYLLTSRALVFDTNLMTRTNDIGSYAQQ